MSIDVHNHFYPASYLKALRTGKYRAKLSSVGGSDPILRYAGDYNILVPGHRELETRLYDMDQNGIETHILSLTTPGVHIEEAKAGTALAQKVNDEFARIRQDHPGRFYAFAALPLQDPEAAARELERAVKKLGLAGATLFTNVENQTLDDPAFDSLFSTAQTLDVPLFLHPTTPKEHGSLARYRLVPLLGFLFDTTTAVARLIFAGVFERYPKLKLIASHLGGTLPYVAERLDRGYRAYPELWEEIPQRPSTYLRRLFYDTVSFDPKVLEFVRTALGAEQMLLGSDYPHQIGDMRQALSALDQMAISEAERKRIQSINAQSLFGIGN